MSEEKVSRFVAGVILAECGARRAVEEVQNVSAAFQLLIAGAWVQVARVVAPAPQLHQVIRAWVYGVGLEDEEKYLTETGDRGL